MVSGPDVATPKWTPASALVDNYATLKCIANLDQLFPGKFVLALVFCVNPTRYICYLCLNVGIC